MDFLNQDVMHGSKIKMELKNMANSLWTDDIKKAWDDKLKEEV